MYLLYTEPLSHSEFILNTEPMSCSECCTSAVPLSRTECRRCTSAVPLSRSECCTSFTPYLCHAVNAVAPGIVPTKLSAYLSSSPELVRILTPTLFRAGRNLCLAKNPFALTTRLKWQRSVHAGSTHSCVLQCVIISSTSWWSNYSK
jgi:hypothetical protein